MVWLPFQKLRKPKLSFKFAICQKGPLNPNSFKKSQCETQRKKKSIIFSKQKTHLLKNPILVSHVWSEPTLRKQLIFCLKFENWNRKDFVITRNNLLIVECKRKPQRQCKKRNSKQKRSKNQSSKKDNKQWYHFQLIVLLWKNPTLLQLEMHVFKTKKQQRNEKKI